MNKFKKVLILDDDAVFMKLLEDGLNQKKSYKIFTARDGEEGLKSALENKPDVILSDLMMPKVNGLEFVKKIRSYPELAHTPVFIISQVSDPEKVAEGAILGISGYIVKSDLSMDSIIQIIDNATLIS